MSAINNTTKAHGRMSFEINWCPNTEEGAEQLYLGEQEVAVRQVL